MGTAQASYARRPGPAGQTDGSVSPRAACDVPRPAAPAHAAPLPDVVQQACDQTHGDLGHLGVGDRGRGAPRLELVGHSRCSRSPTTSYDRRGEQSTARCAAPPAVLDLVGARARTARRRAAPAARRRGTCGCRRPGRRRALKPSRRLVDPAQRLGLGDPHRRVGERSGQVAAASGRSRAMPANRCHTPRRWRRGGSSTSTWIRSGGTAGDQRSSTRPQVEGPPVPDRRAGRRTPSGRSRPAGWCPVLEALLPAGGEQPERLAGGHDQVHLGGRAAPRPSAPACSATPAQKNSWLISAVAAGARPARPAAAAQAVRCARARARRWRVVARRATPTGGRGARRPGTRHRPPGARRGADQRMVWR